MRPTGKLLAVLLALALLAPTTALAQSAGDQQYVDPFQGQEEGGGGGGNDNGNSGSQGGESDQGPTTTTTEPAPSDTAGATAESTTPATAGATLPRTGDPLLPVVLTGALLFGTGLLLRLATLRRRA